MLMMPRSVAGAPGLALFSGSFRVHGLSLRGCAGPQLSVTSASAEIRGGTIAGGAGSANGTGLRVESASVLVVGTAFESNAAGGYGGAI